MLKKNKFHILILIIPIILTISWFIQGKQIASGEEGLSLFNHISVENQISLWQNTGTGYSIPFYLNRLLPVLLINVANRLVIPLFLIQAVFYLFILSTGLMGMFLLSKLFFEEYSFANKIAFIAALFYLFNLYTLSQIFNRFLYSSMFLWSYLPWFLFLWMKWIIEAKIKYIIIFLFFSILFSLAYSQPAHVLTLWSPAIIWSVVSIINHKEGGRGRVFFLTIFGLILWCLINIWWLYPYMKLGVSIIPGSSAESTLQANFNSLIGVSKYFTMQDILFLKQSYLFGANSFWYPFYSNLWIRVISIVPFSIVVIGWFATNKYRYRNYLTILALVGLFVSKGVNPPLGHGFFFWLFKYIPQTMVLRNPYEKFGLVWLLPYAIFFSVGLIKICRKIGLKLSNLFLILVLFCVCGILLLPMWTGSLYINNAKIKIPSYYNEANQYLNHDRSDGRILMLPLINGDGVKYEWRFRGIEASEFLFDKPVVSKILRTKYFDNKYTALYNQFVNNQDYEQLLEEMNIKYLILHHDLDIESIDTSPSAQVAKDLDRNSNLKLLKDIGKLSIYEFIPNTNGKLFIAEGENIPNIGYEKLGTTQYKIFIQNATRSFNLIFKSTFNEFWEASINGAKINDHFLVYDYANGWRITKTGNYIIDVMFKVWPW